MAKLQLANADIYCTHVYTVGIDCIPLGYSNILFHRLCEPSSSLDVCCFTVIFLFYQFLCMTCQIYVYQLHLLV